MDNSSVKPYKTWATCFIIKPEGKLSFTIVCLSSFKGTNCLIVHKNSVYVTTHKNVVEFGLYLTSVLVGEVIP